jgi:hypothetical protein
LPSTAYLDDLHAVSVEVIVVPKTIQRRSYFGEGGVAIQHRELFECERAAGGEQRGLNQLSELGHGESPVE